MPSRLRIIHGPQSDWNTAHLLSVISERTHVHSYFVGSPEFIREASRLQKRSLSTFHSLTEAVQAITENKRTYVYAEGLTSIAEVEQVFSELAMSNLEVHLLVAFAMEVECASAELSIRVTSTHIEVKHSNLVKELQASVTQPMLSSVRVEEERDNVVHRHLYLIETRDLRLLSNGDVDPMCIRATGRILTARVE